MLERLDSALTRLIQAEAFMGPLAGLIRHRVESWGPGMYQSMCERLKRYCEMVCKTQG